MSERKKTGTERPEPAVPRVLTVAPSASVGGGLAIRDEEGGTMALVFGTNRTDQLALARLFAASPGLFRSVARLEDTLGHLVEAGRISWTVEDAPAIDGDLEMARGFMEEAVDGRQGLSEAELAEAPLGPMLGSRHAGPPLMDALRRVCVLLHRRFQDGLASDPPSALTIARGDNLSLALYHCLVSGRCGNVGEFILGPNAPAFAPLGPAGAAAYVAERMPAPTTAHAAENLRRMTDIVSTAQRTLERSEATPGRWPLPGSHEHLSDAIRSLSGDPGSEIPWIFLCALVMMRVPRRWLGGSSEESAA